MNEADLGMKELGFENEPGLENEPAFDNEPECARFMLGYKYILVKEWHIGKVVHIEAQIYINSTGNWDTFKHHFTVAKVEHIGKVRYIYSTIIQL